MKNLRYYLILLVLISSLIFIRWLKNSDKTHKVPVTAGVSLENALILFPQAKKVVPPQKETGWTLVLDEKGETLGAVVLTSPFCDHIRGYGGNTPLIIAIDKEENIIGIEILKNHETPGFLNRVKSQGFFQRWNGMNWEDPKVQEIDTVTGATMTTDSVKKTLLKRFSLIDSRTDIFPPEVSRGFSLKDGGIILLALTGIILCLGDSNKFNNYKIIRWIQIGVSVLFLGFITAQCLSMALLGGWLIHGVDISLNIGIFVLFILAVWVPVITGKNFYCFFVCPFGGLQEILFAVSKKVQIIPRLKIPANIIKMIKYIRFIMLIIILLSLAFNLGINPNHLEPFSAFLFLATGFTPAVGIAILFLFLSPFTYRPWCSYGCATGGLIDILKRNINSDGDSSQDNP